MSKLIEIKDKGYEIFGIVVNNKEIGTIHLGTEHNNTDASIIHIALHPTFYQTKYVISEVKVTGNDVYIRLET